MEGPEGMKCHRCGGVMVHERFYGGDDRYLGWRCVICGEIIDEVILENRRWVPEEPKHKNFSAKAGYGNRVRDQD